MGKKPRKLYKIVRVNYQTPGGGVYRYYLVNDYKTIKAGLSLRKAISLEKRLNESKGAFEFYKINEDIRRR